MNEYFALNMTTDLTSLNERFSQGWVIDRTLEGHGAGMVVIMSRYHPQNRAECAPDQLVGSGIRSGLSAPNRASY